MLPRYHQHLVINASIVVGEKVNKLGHEDLTLAEGSRKGGDAGGITSLRSCRFYRLVEAISRPKINAECSHEVGCLVDSAASPINYISHSFCITGERVYDAENIFNLMNICEHLPRCLNGR